MEPDNRLTEFAVMTSRLLADAGWIVKRDGDMLTVSDPRSAAFDQGPLTVCLWPRPQHA